MNREAEPKSNLEEFTKEICQSDPEFVKNARTDYLTAEILKLLRQGTWWVKIANAGPSWWQEAIQESVIGPDEKKILKMTREILAYDSPATYTNKITQADIDRAAEIPLDEIANITFRKSGGNTMKGLCPFHTEKTPSFVWYVMENRYCCFGCGQKGGGVIDYLMQVEQLEFIPAVKRLLGR
jgi:hypothetical protein